jgi:phage-related protein
MKRYRQIIYFKNHYFDFFDKQSERLKDKIDYVLFLITVADRIPKKFFQHLEGTNGLYEIRVEYQGNIFRIFCCFDERNLVVLFNGFQKKSQKTPKSELEKAVKIMKEYFDEQLTWKQNESKKRKK